MISLLARIFIKKRDDVKNPEVRKKYGMICGICGILLNVLLFAGKYIVGTLSGSIAITADSFNNLSDAGSSLITTLGFRLAGMKATKEHPFGHERIEYISGFAVSILIMLMGFELFKSSAQRIMNPAIAAFDWLTFGILIASVLVKLYMFLYNNLVGKKVDSVSIRATATDSISDAIATTVVLISVVVSPLIHFDLDGICGVLVSLFIFKAGIGAAKDTLAPLLGKTPEPEFVSDIEKIVRSYGCVVGIHDLIVHDYGPGRMIISLHAEVPENGNLFELHDSIDCIERELKEKLGCEATIHMDPIATDDALTTALRKEIEVIVKEIDTALMFHDFRIVTGATHTNLIFDLVVPFKYDMTDDELCNEISEKVKQKHPDYFCVITAERAYV